MGATRGRATWPTAPVETLERQNKAQEGIGFLREGNTSQEVRIHCRSKALKAMNGFCGAFRCAVEAPPHWLLFNNQSMRWMNAKKAIPRRRAAGPGSEGKSLESAIPWALPARNKAGRLGEE